MLSLFLYSNHAYLHRADGSENQFYLSFDMPQANMPNSVDKKLLFSVFNGVRFIEGKANSVNK